MGRYAGLREARLPESRRAPASDQPALPGDNFWGTEGNLLPDADLQQALTDLQSEVDTARRIEALRDLESATDHFRDQDTREAVEALQERVPEPLARAIDAAMLRARLQDQVRKSSPGGASAKAELAQQILLDGTADERRRFLEGTFETEAVGTLPALIEHLERESDPRVRTLVAKAIGAFGSKANIDAFKSATRDPETEVRVGAVEGLLYQHNKAAMRLLLERLTDSEKEVREAAVKVLASYPMDEVVATLSGLPEGKGSKLKRGAVRVIKLYPEHEGAAKLLRRYLDSSSALLSAEALVALAAQGDDVALARILELDGRCDAKMQRVLDMAKEAYGAFSEVAVDRLKEETSVVSGVVSMPPLHVPSAPTPDPDPTPASEPESSAEEGGDDDEDSGDWEVERPPTRPSNAPDELPSEVEDPTEAQRPPSAPIAAEEAAASDAPRSPSSPPSAPGLEGEQALAQQETIIGQADPPPPEEAAEESDVDNPWESIAGPADPAVAQAGLREEGATSSGTPDAPTPIPSGEEPVEPTFPIPDGSSEPPAATSSPGPDAPPTPPAPVRRGWRLAILCILLVGVGGTGWMAYQAGVARGQVDAQGEELRVEMNRLLQALRNAEAGKGRQFRPDEFEALVAEALPESPQDPWGNAYRYDPVLRRLLSTGADGLIDGAARFGQEDISSDDAVRFLDAPPAPLGVSFAGPTGFALAATRPGETAIEALRLGEGEGAPIRPAFTTTMSRVAYLLESPDGTGFEAYFRRRKAGQAIAWDPPEPLLPAGWTASELAWAREGEVVLTVARSADGLEALYGVEPGSQPILLSEKLKDALNLRLHPDGKHFLVSAIRPSTTSLDGVRHVVLGVLTGKGLSPKSARFKWGPKGHTALFTEDRGRILVVGPDPDLPNMEALIEFVPPSEDGPATSRKLLGGIHSLTCAILSRDSSLLAYCEGKNVVVMRLSTLDQAAVFVAPAVPSALIWPVPVNL